MRETLSPATVSVMFRDASAIFKAAVMDWRIVASPGAVISVPSPRPRKVEPVATESIETIVGAVSPRYWALVI
ncbi:hypothetical protein [Demequina aurantiaca]|uniref:hypothetical protein n=1 Tax=Demequina aurantiaca TaxID=676200 RepID=UPI003D32CC54